jgi:hypothetical protein
VKRIARLLLTVLPLAIGACSASAEIVWVGGEDGGARLATCPVAGCEPLIALARTSLDRSHPGHAAIVKERLGVPSCGPTENVLCAYGGTLGIASRWAVVFDLADETTRIGTVLCFEPTNDDGVTVAWNGERCHPG